MTDRTCDTTGCDRKRHARGLCASCYAKQYKAKHYTTDPHECAHCGVTFKRYSISRSECCSNECAQRLRFGWPKPSASVELVHIPRATPVATVPPKRSRWFGCRCATCGEAFIAEGFHSTCSERCGQTFRRRKKRDHCARRKLAQGRFAVAHSIRMSIYERDGWTCQICGGRTSTTYRHDDPWSPTLDHIIPQSTQALPDHSPGNLRLVHALCNSLRGDRPVTDEQVALLATQEPSYGMVHQ